jgi:hypothetical protein
LNSTFRKRGLLSRETTNKEVAMKGGIVAMRSNHVPATGGG